MLPLSSRCRWPWTEPPGSAFQGLVLWPHLACLLFQRFSLSCCPRGWHSPKHSCKPLLLSFFFWLLFYVIWYYYWNSNQLCRFFCFSQIRLHHHHFFLPLVSEQKQLFPPFPTAFASVPFLQLPSELRSICLCVFSIKKHLFPFISSSHLVRGLAPAVLKDTLSGSHASFWKPLYIRKALDSTLELDPWASCLVWCVNLFA